MRSFLTLTLIFWLRALLAVPPVSTPFDAKGLAAEDAKAAVPLLEGIWEGKLEVGAIARGKPSRRRQPNAFR
jgi:hypothetical protein